MTSEGAFVLDAALDHLGAVHVMTTKRYVVVDGDRVVDGTLPPGATEAEGIASCDGRIWAAFAIAGTLLAGTWNGSAWQLEPVPHPHIGHVAVSFDEACRPFLGIHDRVYARGAAGWVGTAVPDAESVKGVAARDGVIYVAYERIRDGVEVGVATGALDPTSPR